MDLISVISATVQSTTTDNISMHADVDSKCVHNALNEGITAENKNEPSEGMKAKDNSCTTINNISTAECIDSKLNEDKVSVELVDKKKPSTDNIDPYAYLKRDDFTSENFKIEIRQLPKYYGISEMKKLLNEKLKLNTCKIKCPGIKTGWVYVSFRNEEDKVKAIEVLNGYKWKGKVLKASVAKPMPDPLVKKRKDNSSEHPGNKRPKPNDKSQEERLKDATIPFWNIPYDEQLTSKSNDMKAVMKKLGDQLFTVNPDLRRLIEERRSEHDGLPCQLLNIRHAEQTDRYRNKCEFTVGMDEETGLPTVGFRLGSYVSGFTGVAPVESLVHIPDRMKTAVKLFEKLVRRSELDVFNPEVHSGHFRQLMARYATTTDELMLVVGFHPQDLTVDQLVQFKTDLVTFFTEGEGKEAKVTSLYCQTIVRRRSGQAPATAEHLHGDVHIHEILLGLKFAVSPEAFFQVNTGGACVLYESAMELAAATRASTVVDVCCGTGTIGLCFSRTCGQVLGLELVPQAILDAKENARVNGVDNCEFFTGRAEEILSSVMCRASGEDVIAIVDPPRAGLHQKAVQQLRRTTKLNKLVYISCDPATAFKNFVDLGRAESKTLHGDPFVPVRAVAVDMFPHTSHCELLICFERAS